GRAVEVARAGAVVPPGRVEPGGVNDRMAGRLLDRDMLEPDATQVVGDPLRRAGAVRGVLRQRRDAPDAEEGLVGLEPLVSSRRKPRFDLRIDRADRGGRHGSGWYGTG